MKNRRLVFTGMTHTAALLVGWGGWTAFRHAEKTESPTTSASTKARERDSDGAKTVDQILAVISPKETDETPGKSQQEWEARSDKYRTDFNDLVRTMAVPDDLKAALETEMKLWGNGEHGQSAKMAALMYFWADKDLPGLLKWADRNDEAKATALGYHMQTILEKTVEEKGMKAIFGMPKDAEWAGNIIYYAANIVGKSGDPAKIAEAKEALDPRQWRNFKMNLAGYWPWAERSKFLEFAISESQPDMIPGLARTQRGNSAEASAWLLELMNDETLDPGFREKLAKDGGVKSLANGDPEIPMTTRLALLQASDPAAPAGQGLDQLATNDVRNILRGAQDWSYEFRHGAMEADEVLAAFTAKFPEQAAKAPDAVRNALFEELIEEDSERAMDLLKDLSPEARSKALLEATRNAFFRVDPNHFLTALQQVPPDDPALWDARLDAWVKHGPDNYNRLDTAYVDWVRALPGGVDRDMALYSLAMASQERNPSLAEELRGEVKNARIKQKIGGVQ